MEERFTKYTRLLDPAGDGERPGDAPGVREPERRLMFAVLVDAITHRDGWWVAGYGGLGPFTFVNVCEVLGFDHRRLGAALLVAFARDGAIWRPRRRLAIGMNAANRGRTRRRRAQVKSSSA